MLNQPSHTPSLKSRTGLGGATRGARKESEGSCYIGDINIPLTLTDSKTSNMCGFVDPMSQADGHQLDCCTYTVWKIASK